MRRQGTSPRVLLGAGALLLLLGLRSLPAETPVSVILVTIDTLRADHLPMWGSTTVQTPALERLAAQSVLFEQTFTPVPLTLPSHTSLLTGTYPQFHGLRDNSGGRLRKGLPTLAAILKERGYLTAAFLGASVLDRSFGLDRGFDHYGDHFQGGRLLGVTAERPAARVIDEALGWLRSARPPFFIWVHLYDPHAPYSPPGRFRGRGYSGEIEYADSQLDRLFQFLEKRGWWDSSLLALLSDHGEDLGEHGEPTHGFFIYDTVLHVPFLLKLPGEAQAGLRVSEQVRTIDLLPTLLQVLKIPLPSSLQGRGLLGHILGREKAPLPAYAETLYPNLHFGWSGLFALRSRGFKFIQAPQPELYDLSHDPAEQHNLYSTRLALARQLESRLEALRARYARPGRGGAPVELDPGVRERLRSLGYATLSTGKGRQEDFANLPDPKAKIQVYAGIYRGMQAFVEKKYEAALRFFLEAKGKDNSVPLVEDYLGSTYLALKRSREAVAAYRRALEMAPGSAEITMNLAHAYLESGQYREAAEGFRLVSRLRPRDWQPWQLLGVSLLRQGKLKEALSALEESKKRNPEQSETLYNMGLVYQQQGQFLMAIQTFRNLLDTRGGDAEMWNNLGNSYQGAGLVASAEKAFRKALALKPSYAAAHYNYGNLLARRGEWEKAANEFQRATRADPRFAAAFHNLAVALETLGRREDAARARARYRKLSGSGKP